MDNNHKIDAKHDEIDQHELNSQRYMAKSKKTHVTQWVSAVWHCLGLENRIFPIFGKS